MRATRIAGPWIAALALAGLAQAAAALEIERSFDVAAGGTLEIDTDLGAIEVSTHEQDRVDLRVVATGKNADQLEVEFEQRGDTLGVRARQPGSWGYHRDLKVRIHAVVPREFDLDLDTAGGSIEVGDLEGEVKADTSGGSIAVGNVSGRVRVSTSGGSIEILEGASSVEADTSGGSIRIVRARDWVDADTSGGSIVIEESAGPVRADTSGGSISLRAASGPVRASTSGGNLRASFVGQPDGDSQLSTSGGKVTVYLAAGLAFDIEADSGGGVRSDFELSEARVTPHRLEGRLNGGGPRLELDATSAIRIEALRD